MTIAYCSQPHPISDDEARHWCERYHRPRLPRLENNNVTYRENGVWREEDTPPTPPTAEHIDNLLDAWEAEEDQRRRADLVCDLQDIADDWPEFAHRIAAAGIPL